jgi:hypothetical protein
MLLFCDLILVDCPVMILWPLLHILKDHDSLGFVAIAVPVDFVGLLHCEILQNLMGFLQPLRFLSPGRVNNQCLGVDQCNLYEHSW